MTKKSAGILLFRITTEPEFFLVHPGGPFWAKKDDHAWSIPKGEFNDDEQPVAAAVREFREETGFDIAGNLIPLTPVKMSSGKIVYAYALQHDADEKKIKSNTFVMEWPPKSGIMKEFPEIDRAGWFNYKESITKLNKALIPLVTELNIRLL